MAPNTIPYAPVLDRPPSRRQVFARRLRGFLGRGAKRLLGVRLGILRRHEPRPLRVPAHYSQPLQTGAPLSISVVTPSYNQGRFLEQTIKSVLTQGYPRLEYIVQDGGSVDQTPAILSRYRHRLTRCESAPDNGQAHAINLGFRHTSGDLMAWLNADDLLLPGTLHYVAHFFHRHPEIDVVYGHRVLIDETDREINRWVLPPHSDAILSWVDYVPQETLFWRRSLWEKVGACLDETFQFALDWELLLRFRDAGARFRRLPRFLGAFRVHPSQKSSAQIATVGTAEFKRLLDRCHGRPVSLPERCQNALSYVLQHAVCHQLYRLGVFRY